MLDKILPAAQFRFICQETTRDNSKAPTQKQAGYDEQICCIAKNVDPTLSPDLCVHNGKKKKFEKIWEISKNCSQRTNSCR